MASITVNVPMVHFCIIYHPFVIQLRYSPSGKEVNVSWMALYQLSRPWPRTCPGQTLQYVTLMSFLYSSFKELKSFPGFTLIVRVTRLRNINRHRYRYLKFLSTYHSLSVQRTATTAYLIFAKAKVLIFGVCISLIHLMFLQNTYYWFQNFQLVTCTIVD